MPRTASTASPPAAARRAAILRNPADTTRGPPPLIRETSWRHTVARAKRPGRPQSRDRAGHQIRTGAVPRKPSRARCAGCRPSTIPAEVHPCSSRSSGSACWWRVTRGPGRHCGCRTRWRGGSPVRHPPRWSVVCARLPGCAAARRSASRSRSRSRCRRRAGGRPAPAAARAPRWGGSCRARTACLSSPCVPGRSTARPGPRSAPTRP